MKTKAVIIGLALTGFVSGQLFAQVDTLPRKKEKTDTTWKDKKDTTKKDTNQVSLNHYYRQSGNDLFKKNNRVFISGRLTNDMIAADNRWYVRKYRGEQLKPTI